MAQLSSDLLAEVLVGAGLIPREQLETVSGSRTNDLEKLDETLVRLGLARGGGIFSPPAPPFGARVYPRDRPRYRSRSPGTTAE